MPVTRSLHENNIFGPRFVLGWVFFAAAAGFVNAAALMAGNNVVSHVTGSITTLATDPSVTVRVALVVAAFLVGGVLAAFAKETLSPWVAYVLPPAGASFVLLGVAALGHAGVFGTFGGDNDVKQHAFPMLALLALAMGMLNASVGAATANRIRVTHFTGPLTDLAGHIVRGELGWIALRVGKVVAFIAGGAFAASLAPRFEFGTFAVGAGFLVVAVALTSRSDERDDAPSVADIELARDR